MRGGVCRQEERGIMSTEPKTSFEPTVVTAEPRRKLARKWKILIGVAVALVLLIAWGSYASKMAKIPRVTVAKVERQDIVSKVTANGKIQAEKKVDLSALVMGQIVNLAVREGDHG